MEVYCIGRVRHALAGRDPQENGGEGCARGRRTEILAPRLHALLPPKSDFTLFATSITRGWIWIVPHQNISQ
jgi:hypothetical protein